MSGGRRDERELRVGVLYPAHPFEPEAWIQAEDDYVRLPDMITTPMAVKVVHTSWGTAPNREEWGVDVLKELGDDVRLLAGADELREFQPDVVVWACTSGSFLWGRAGAERQAQVVADALGVPASSTSLAFVHALAALGLTRVAVPSVYNQTVSEAFRAFLGTADVETVNLVLLEDSGGDFEWGRHRLLEIVDECNVEEAEGIVIPETGLHTIEWLEELEARAAKPVLTANQVTMWHAMSLVDGIRPQQGLGSLFRLETVSYPTPA